MPSEPPDDALSRRSTSSGFVKSFSYASEVFNDDSVVAMVGGIALAMFNALEQSYVESESYEAEIG